MKQTLVFIFRYIEEFFLGILILYSSIYFIIELKEKNQLYTYILILLLGIYIGCSLTIKIYRYLKPNSNLWQNKNNS